MKKNVFHWMLTAAVVCGLGMSVTSCKDVDNGTVNTHFDDGTRILQYKSMLAEKEDFYNNFMDPGVLAYPGMVTNAIYINDQLGGFGITNAR